MNVDTVQQILGYLYLGPRFIKKSSKVLKNSQVNLFIDWDWEKLLWTANAVELWEMIGRWPELGWAAEK